MGRQKDNTMRMTPQRAAILEYLEGNKDHPSADDIYRGVRKRYPMMSLATVYNTLETLIQSSSITEVTIDRARKRYDPDTEPHHHLVCTNCGRVIDIHRNFRLAIPARDREGFELTGNHVEFYGICPGCQGKKG